MVTGSFAQLLINRPQTFRAEQAHHIKHFSLLRWQQAGVVEKRISPGQQTSFYDVNGTNLLFDTSKNGIAF